MPLDFDLSEEQQMLRKRVRNFAEREIAPIAQELDDKEEFSYTLTKRMGDLGLFGPFVPEEYGGSNVGYVSYIIAVEEIARIDGSQAATLAAGNSLGISPIYYYGNEDQKQKWLPELCSGKGLSSFGLTEANAGSDAGSSQTNGVLQGDHWIINGSKIFITNSTTDISRVCVVQAVTGKSQTGKNELSCILVPNGTPRFRPRRRCTRPRQKVLAVYWRSFMAAQRGDCTSAGALRREGLATGLVYNDYLCHWWNAVGKARNCKELPGLTTAR